MIARRDRIARRERSSESRPADEVDAPVTFATARIGACITEVRREGPIGAKPSAS
jgi:hypothetical protein